MFFLRHRTLSTCDSLVDHQNGQRTRLTCKRPFFSDLTPGAIRCPTPAPGKKRSGACTGPGDYRNARRSPFEAFPSPFLYVPCVRRVLWWDVDKPESASEDTKRHVREGEERIAKQERLIAKLERDGHENSLPAARALLAQMKASQELSCEHLRRDEAKPPGALPDDV